MSDQPGIPAITVFPPFNPAPRQPEPEAEPVRDQAPAEPPAAPAEAYGRDVAAPPAPAPWDFEAPADDARAQAEPAPLSEEEDLPWLEVPEPARARGADKPEAELKADEAPNWMAWVRDEGQAPPADEPTPIADLQPDDAQPWAPETETAADDWAAESETTQPEPEPWKAPPSPEPGEPAPDPWQAPPSPEPEAPQPDPWQAPPSEPDVPEPQTDGWKAPQAEGASAEAGDEPGTELDVPEPELYDLPDVAPAATPWVEAEAPLFEPPAANGDEEEPAWELPSQSAPDAPPAWESFAPTAADPQLEPQAAARQGSGPFAAVADRLQEIADALRADPGAFLSGAQGGG
ncbi:MAG TPA: hypothetical protein VGO40_06085, partial [Longimicrobium sp.]|nr:hypothetical protein [Longimicrobium sp.]